MKIPLHPANGIVKPAQESIHAIKITISFDYNLIAPHITQEKNPDLKKYYITYSLGGQVEGKVIFKFSKTELLHAGLQRWYVTHDLNVNNVSIDLR
jgi:hypothetical protein